MQPNKPSTKNFIRPPSKALLIQILLIIIVWIAWFTAMSLNDLFYLFPDKGFMTLTMMFGSFIAGATSEGGGAVAFPVMTLLFNIEPQVARDFSLMIQSVGMGSAAYSIFLLKIPVEYRTLLFAGIGGLPGIIVGLEFIAPMLTAAYTKTFFLSLWLSFAAALYWINRDINRHIFNFIHPFGLRQALLLLTIGFFGGIISGLTGTGLDILVFALLTLVFCINEKVATPTSVVLMAGNSIAGFAWQTFAAKGVAEQAWSYWWVSVPVVVIGAPLGAMFIYGRSRLFVTYILYASIISQYLAGLVLIQQSSALLVFNVTVFIIGSILFHSFANSGKMLVHNNNPKQN